MPVESHMALSEHQIKQLKSHDPFVDLIYKRQFFLFTGSFDHCFVAVVFAKIK